MMSTSNINDAVDAAPAPKQYDDDTNSNSNNNNNWCTTTETSVKTKTRFSIGSTSHLAKQLFLLYLYYQF